MKVVCLGFDGDTLRQRGYDVVDAERRGAEGLREAGIETADAFVVEGRENALQVVVALDIDPEVRTVLVSDDAPDYVRGSVDFILPSGLADRVHEALPEG